MHHHGATPLAARPVLALFASLFLRRRLGDKACPGCWASGSPRHACVWRPPYEIRRGKASGERLEACGGRRSSKSRGRRNRAGNRADAMKTGGNRPRRVRARRKRAGIDRIYAVARQTSRSRAFTTGAGRCSFTERGEEKRRRPCFLAAEAEAEACRSLLESTGRAQLPRIRPCISS